MNTISYEIHLHEVDGDEIAVDVHKNAYDKDGNDLDNTELERHSFEGAYFGDRYRQAKRQMIRLVNKYNNKIIELDLNYPEIEHMVLENDDIFHSAQARLDSLSHIIEMAEKELEHNK